jgi:hypothetical protein
VALVSSAQRVGRNQESAATGLSTGRAQEMQKRVPCKYHVRTAACPAERSEDLGFGRRQYVTGSKSKVRRRGMLRKPGENALFKFLWRRAHRSAVIGVRNFPEHGLRISLVNETRVSNGNVSIDLAVNQEYGDWRGRDPIFRRDLLQIEPVFPAGPQKCGFDEWTEKRTPEPRSHRRAEMKRLSHAVVSDFVKIRKRGFSDDGAEMRTGSERLQKLRGAHGFSQAEDAARMILRRQQVEPLPNVVALEQTVGGERAAAGALRAGVGEEDAVAVSEQQVRVSGHADAVVAEAVKEDDGISVSVPRMDGPGTEHDRVGRGDGNVLQIGVEGVGGFDHGGFIFERERTTRRVQCAVGDPDSSDGAEGEIENDGENQAS